MKNLKFIIYAIILNILILTTVVVILSQSRIVYDILLEKTNAYENSELKKDDFDNTVDALVDFIKNERQDLFIKINGESLFKAQEIFHMLEVKSIFQFMKKLIVILLISIVVIVYLLKDKNQINKIFKYQFYTNIVFITFFAISAKFFDKAFIIMHKLLFNNDYWLFTSEHYLTKILNQDFFMGFFLIIVSVYMLSSIILYIKTFLRSKN